MVRRSTRSRTIIYFFLEKTKEEPRVPPTQPPGTNSVSSRPLPHVTCPTFAPKPKMEQNIKGGIQISKFQKGHVTNQLHSRAKIQFAPRVSSPNIAHPRTTNTVTNSVTTATTISTSSKIYVQAGPRSRVPPGTGPGSLRQTGSVGGHRPFRGNPVRMNGPTGNINVNGPTGHTSGNGPHGAHTSAGRINGEGRTVIGTKTVGGQKQEITMNNSALRSVRNNQNTNSSNTPAKGTPQHTPLRVLFTYGIFQCLILQQI